MLLLKITYKSKETKYYKIDEDRLISLKSQRKIKLELDGDIELLHNGREWRILNKTDIPLRYGRGKINPLQSKPLKYGKPFSYKGNTMIPIEYKQKAPQKISAGLREKINLANKVEYIIGSADDCDVIIDNPQVDRHNTRIIHDGDIYYIEDLNSSNGLYINGNKYKNKILEDYDTITLPGAIYMIVGDILLHSESNTGIKIDVKGISKTVRDFKTHKPIKLVNDINLTINAGEYIAVVGGSGAGKSTFLDCVNGRRPMTEGKVYYDLNDYYEYFNSYQKIVGYVPQSDIMHTDLSIYKTLYYYAQIRMHHHLNKSELNDLVLKTIDEVSLKEKKDVIVSSLSGGQRKRVSIAMELLANPKVIFLDEPTSGLSPDLDYDIMELLRKLADKGKTIIVITHNMENVDKCDKIAFLGKGGKLCYYGSPKEIFKYFGVRKYGQIFSMLTSDDKVSFYQNKLRESLEYNDMLDAMNDIYEGGNKNAKEA